MRGSWMLSNLYAVFTCSGSPSIFIWHWMCALILFPSGSRALIGSICLSYFLGVFIHKQFKVAPLSAIRSKFLTQRSWDFFLIVTNYFPTLSCTYALSLPYWFSPILLVRVAQSLWIYLLLWHVVLSWLMFTQCLWVQQYPPTSRTCLLFTHLEFACPCLSTGILDPLLFTAFACCSWWVKAETVAARSAIVLHWDIMVSLLAAAAVARLMMVLCVPSISLKLFALWYPPVRVETFCFLLNLRCAAWKCAWKFAQFFFPRCLSSHL